MFIHLFHGLFSQSDQRRIEPQPIDSQLSAQQAELFFWHPWVFLTEFFLTLCNFKQKAFRESNHWPVYSVIAQQAVQRELNLLFPEHLVTPELFFWIEYDFI